MATFNVNPTLTTTTSTTTMMMVMVVAGADINECDEFNGRCTQRCSNNIGSYRCSCRTGFQLALDRRTCVGEQTKLQFFFSPETAV